MINNIQHLCSLLSKHGGHDYDKTANWTIDLNNTWKKVMSTIEAAAVNVGDFEMVRTQIHSQNFPTHKVREYGYFFLKWKEGLTELHDSISVEIHNQFIRIWMHRVEKEKQEQGKKELLQLRIEAIRLQFEPYRIDIAKEEKDDSLYLDEICEGITQMLHHWKEAYQMGWTRAVDIKAEFVRWAQGPNFKEASAKLYANRYLGKYISENTSQQLNVFAAWSVSSLETLRDELENDPKWQQWKQSHRNEAGDAVSAINKYQNFLEKNNLFQMSTNNSSDESEQASWELSSLNTILYGPPGTGKTYNTKRYAVATCGGTISDDADIKKQYKDLVEEGRIKFVTFHQSYGYEEFIQGIAAKVNEESRQVEYTTKDGVFVRFCKEAAKIENKDRNYIFIIDEINRGNISKIFGELITLIEDTKREGCDDAQFAELPHGGRFSVPANVYILGTMNTADRSIALLDTALRRRFDFIEMMPSQTLLDGVTVDGINIQKLLNCMNERIEFLFDREHTIGHAFFMSLRKNPTAEKLKEIFRNKVIPLLQEYFYDDYQKIGLVLGSSFVKKAKAPDSLQKQNLGDVYRIADKDEWNFKAILTATDSEKSEDSESE